MHPQTIPVRSSERRGSARLLRRSPAGAVPSAGDDGARHAPLLVVLADLTSAEGRRGILSWSDALPGLAEGRTLRLRIGATTRSGDRTLVLLFGIRGTCLWHAAGALTPAVLRDLEAALDATVGRP